MRRIAKIHYGAPTSSGWQPVCGAAGRGANCTPLATYVECKRCKKMMAACDTGASP